MKNWLATVAGAALIAAAGTQPAAAAVPVGSCPNPASGFQLYTDAELLEIFVSPGAAEFIAETDKNDDRRVCVKDIPNTPGNPPTARIVVDNSTRS